MTTDIGSVLSRSSFGYIWTHKYVLCNKSQLDLWKYKWAKGIRSFLTSFAKPSQIQCLSWGTKGLWRYIPSKSLQTTLDLILTGSSSLLISPWCYWGGSGDTGWLRKVSRFREVLLKYLSPPTELVSRQILKRNDILALMMFCVLK